MDKDKTNALSELYSARENIENKLAEIEATLQVYFNEEFAVASQHWIAQIKTALRDNLKYLPRGEYSMDYTFHRIEDKLLTNSSKGIEKYV